MRLLLLSLAFNACSKVSTTPPEDATAPQQPDLEAPVSSARAMPGASDDAHERTRLAVLTEAGELELIDSPGGARTVLARGLPSGVIDCPAAAPYVVFANGAEAHRYATTAAPPERVSLGRASECDEATGTGACQLELMSSAPDGGSACLILADGPPVHAGLWVSVDVRFDGPRPVVVQECDGPAVGTPFETCDVELPSGTKLRLPGGRCEGYVTPASESGRHVAVLVSGECHDYCYRTVLLVDQVEGTVRAELRDAVAIAPLLWQPGGERLLVSGILLDPSGTVERLGSSACWLAESFE